LRFRVTAISGSIAQSTYREAGRGQGKVVFCSQRVIADSCLALIAVCCWRSLPGSGPAAG